VRRRWLGQGWHRHGSARHGSGRHRSARQRSGRPGSVGGWGLAVRPADGFALPLALGASLVLLLSSLSLQTAALQSMVHSGTALRQRQAEDRLASAAHQLVGELSGTYGCLLALPLAAWAQQGGACSDQASQERLRRNAVLGSPYRLVAWAPSGLDRMDLLLELDAVERQPPRRGRFSVRLLEGGRRTADLQDLGLRGMEP